MATYQLNAADLLTLLASTVTPGTESQILQQILAHGVFPSGPNSLAHVETVAGPPGSVPPVNNDTVAPGTKLELITIPTSTPITGSSFPAPTVGGGAPSAKFNFTNPTGNVIFAAGDQAVTLFDLGTAGGDTLIGGAGFERLVTTGGANMLMGGTGANTLIGGSGAD